MRLRLVVLVTFLLAFSGVVASVSAIPAPPAGLDAYAASTRLDADPEAPLPWTITPGTSPDQTATSARPDPAPASGGPGVALTDADPYQTLLSSLSVSESASPAEIVDAVAQYFHDLGYAVPSRAELQAAQDPLFEENITTYYTYSIPDASGDGVGDLILDTYCLSPDVCRNLNSLSNPSMANLVQYYRCGWPHRLTAVSGIDGTALWNRSLNPSLDLLGVLPYVYQLSCGFAFVIGTVPLADGSENILVYEYGVYRPADVATVRIIQNRIVMVSAQTGETVWEREVLGSYHDSVLGGGPGVVPRFWSAENLFVNPIVQASDEDTIPRPSEGLTATLMLQSVGFNITFLDTYATPVNQVGFNRAIPLIDHYQPIEWAARIEPGSGNELWRTATFRPQTDRSVLPFVLQLPAYPSGSAAAINGPGSEPYTTSLNYWSPQTCCYDVTGDKIPDLAYRTYEWYPLPTANQDGPYWIEAKIHFFDGANGRPLYTHTVLDAGREPRLNDYSQSTELNFRVLFQAIGDVNNDDRSDYAVHLVFDHIDQFNHAVSIRTGETGEELWRIDSARDLAILPIGSATPDGDDLLLVDWFYQLKVTNTLVRHTYNFANVTATPIAVFNGLDGGLLWRETTFMAPTDIVFIMETSRTNGVFDLNSDGVGDFPLDDPLLLPDLTTVHRFRFVSGVDASLLFEHATVGLFGFPARVADVTGDGQRDVGILNGDITDLWLTVVNSTHGDPLWSIRVLSPRSTTYTTATPRMRIHPIEWNVTPQQDFVLNFQLNTFTVGGFIGISPTTPVVGAYDGLEGQVFWTIPRQVPEQVGFVQGSSPATKLFEAAFVHELSAMAVASPEAHFNVVPAVASMIAGFGAAFGITRWRMKS